MLFHCHTKREEQEKFRRPPLISGSFDRNGANSRSSGFSSYARFLSRVHLSKLALLAKKASCFPTKDTRHFPENLPEYSVVCSFNLKTSEQTAVAFSISCLMEWASKDELETMKQLSTRKRFPCLRSLI